MSSFKVVVSDVQETPKTLYTTAIVFAWPLPQEVKGKSLLLKMLCTQTQSPEAPQLELIWNPTPGALGFIVSGGSTHGSEGGEG